MKRKTVTVSYNLDEEVKLAIEETAWALRKSRSSLVNETMKEKLKI